MDKHRVVRFSLFAFLALLLQTGIPTSLAHGGGDEGAEEERATVGFPLTPDREFAEQLNPEMDGPYVVWQERLPGHGETWDIMMANVSEENITAIPITNTDRDEKRPVVHDDRIAWTVIPADDPENLNLALLDRNSGRIHHVPDGGHSEKHPTFAGNGTLLYVDMKDETLKGFDPATGQVFEPIGERDIVGEPAAHEHWIAWAEGSRTAAKLHIKDLRTGEVTKVEGLYTVKDGPEMGSAGLAWIARFGGEFTRGTYTALYNVSTGVKTFKSSVYPHRNVDACEAGVIWDQPGTSTEDNNTVALWDRYVDGTVTFGLDTSSGACGADHLVYERNTQGDPGSEQGTRQLHFLDLRDHRLHRDAVVTIDDDDKRPLLRDIRTLEGEARSRDPREPIVKVFARVDGGPRTEINTTPMEEGVAWKARIDPSGFEAGSHTLSIAAVDTLGRPTIKEFTFYTDTPYHAEPASDADPVIPRQEAEPFPFNVVNHYQDYAPFYNTVLLGLVILVGLVWYGYRWSTERSVGTPEYVPPDETEP